MPGGVIYVNFQELGCCSKIYLNIFIILYFMVVTFHFFNDMKSRTANKIGDSAKKEIRFRVKKCELRKIKRIRNK